MRLRFLILSLIACLTALLLPEADAGSRSATRGTALSGHSPASRNRGCPVSRRAVPSHRGAGQASSVVPRNGPPSGNGWAGDDSDVEFSWAEFLAPDVATPQNQQHVAFHRPVSNHEIVLRRRHRSCAAERDGGPALAALGDSLLLGRPPPATPLSA